MIVLISFVLSFFLFYFLLCLLGCFLEGKVKGFKISSTFAVSTPADISQSKRATCSLLSRRRWFLAYVAATHQPHVNPFYYYYYSSFFFPAVRILVVGRCRFCVTAGLGRSVSRRSACKRWRLPWRRNWLEPRVHPSGVGTGHRF